MQEVFARESRELSITVQKERMVKMTYCEEELRRYHSGALRSG